MLRQIVVNNQRIHAVIHKPLTNRSSREWRHILIRARIRSWRGDYDRVGHGSRVFEDRYKPRDIGLFLTNRNVDAIEWPVALVTRCLGRFVEASLTNDRVDTDRRLAC